VNPPVTRIVVRWPPVRHLDLPFLANNPAVFWSETSPWAEGEINSLARLVLGKYGASIAVANSLFTRRMRWAKAANSRRD
jgi:hypothetical protein